MLKLYHKSSKTILDIFKNPYYYGCFFLILGSAGIGYYAENTFPIFMSTFFLLLGGILFGMFCPSKK